MEKARLIGYELLDYEIGSTNGAISVAEAIKRKTKMKEVPVFMDAGATRVFRGAQQERCREGPETNLQNFVILFSDFHDLLDRQGSIKGLFQEGFFTLVKICKVLKREISPGKNFRQDDETFLIILLEMVMFHRETGKKIFLFK